ncbi:hypothetical protein Scep_003547 [Stephania cephalantha]|uniref:Uncharacterized protein n=1 Tax=Stephania cephalantha TaxID=152367 RepID=A0AAP0KQQ3_9MAGN
MPRIPPSPPKTSSSVARLYLSSPSSYRHETQTQDKERGRGKKREKETTLRVSLS